MDLLNRPFLVFLVIVITTIGNWGIPVAIYVKKFGLFKKRPKGFIGCNFWGVVMDVFIAGAINLVILNFILTVSPKIDENNVAVALVLGFLSMIVTHFLMAATFWREWIMPRPWRWNEAGYWHMVSMTLQMAYAFYPLILMAKTPQLLDLTITRLTLVAAVVFGSMFLGALSVCKKGVGGKPW